MSWPDDVCQTNHRLEQAMFQNSGAGTAACLMIKKNIFEEVLGFDVVFPRFSGHTEELEV
jgi:hypothetical protein